MHVPCPLGAPQYAQQHLVRALVRSRKLTFPHDEPHEIVTGHQPTLLAPTLVHQSVAIRTNQLDTSLPQLLQVTVRVPL